MLEWLHANPSKIGLNVPFTTQVNFRGICMESSEHTIAYISPITWPNKLNFNKQTVFILFFQKSHFCDVTLLYSKQILQTNRVALEHSHWPVSRVLTNVINMMAKYYIMIIFKIWNEQEAGKIYAACHFLVTQNQGVENRGGYEY